MRKALIFIGLICGCMFLSCNGEQSNLPLEPTDKKTETQPKAQTIENKKPSLIIYSILDPEFCCDGIICLVSAYDCIFSFVCLFNFRNTY